MRPVTRPSSRRRSEIEGFAGRVPLYSPVPPYCVSAWAVGALVTSVAVAMINNPVRWSLTPDLIPLAGHEQATSGDS